MLGASTVEKVGEYVLGADPDTEAQRLADRLCAALARTWDDHPDYDRQWSRILRDRDDG